MPIAMALDSTSQSANSPMPPKGSTNYEKGEHYLRLSLTALDELASWSEHERLSENQKASYAEAFRNARTLSEETEKIRNQLLTQKRSFRKFFVNLFIRESSTKRFYKVSSRNYSTIRRTSDDLNRQLLSEIGTLLTSGHLEQSAQGNEAVNEESLRNVEDDLDLSPNENTPGIDLEVHTEHVQETRVAISEDEDNDSTRSPCDVVGGNHSAGLSPDDDTQDINLDVHTEQGVQDAFAIIDELGIKFSREEDEFNDNETIRPSPSQSTPPSPGPSCTINIFYNINQSMVSFDSALTEPTLNVG